MAFNGINMNPIGGNSRAGENAAENAPMGWAYQSNVDDLATVLAAGYFDTFNKLLVTGQFIYVSLTDAKGFLTVQSVDRVLRQVVMDAGIIDASGGSAVQSVFGRVGDVIAQALDYTAALVGLGNVTNDAQLKRSANDFSDFSNKPLPVAGDKILIEDSEAAGVKKEITISNLSGVGAGNSSDREILINNADSTAGDPLLKWLPSKTLQALGSSIQKGGDASNPYSPNTLSVTSFGIGPRQHVTRGNYDYIIDSSADLLQIVDFTIPGSPELVSSITTNSSGTCRGLDVTGDLVYVVVAGVNELRIYDATEKKNPFLVSALALTGTGELRGIRVSGNTAYITTNGFDFTSVDVTAASAPKQLQTIVLSNNSRPLFDVVGTFVYLPLAFGLGGFQIVDAKNPKAMVIRGDFDVNSTGLDVKVEGRYAFLIDGGNLKILDIHDPDNISLKGELGGIPNANSLFVANGFVYITEKNNSDLIIVDARSITNPVRINNTFTIGNGSVSITGIGNQIHVLDNTTNSLYIIDIFSSLIQALVAGTALLGDLQVLGDVSVGKRITTNSINLGRGGLLSAGVVAGADASLVVRLASLDPENLTPIFSLDQLPDELQDGEKYLICAPIPASDGEERTIATGAHVEILTTNFRTNKISYSGNGTLFSGTGIGSLRIDCQIDGNPTGQLFNLSGVRASSFLFFNSGGMDGWGELGELSQFNAVGLNFLVASNFNTGLKINLTNGFFGNQSNWFNTSDSGTDFIAFDSTILRINFVNTGMFVQGTEHAFNVNSAANVSAYFSNILGVPTGLFFNPSGKSKESPGVIVMDCDNIADSTISTELAIEGNTATTSIPATGALVEINVDANWSGLEAERLSSSIGGVTTVTALRPAKLKLDGNIEFAPASGTNKNLAARAVVVQPEQRTITFTNSTNLINETATPRLVDEQLSFRNTAGSLPVELRIDVVYYVVNVTVNAFQIAYTKGGAAILFSDNGSGTNSYQNAEVHGSEAKDVISSGAPRDVIPQASLPVVLGSEIFVVVKNKTDTIGINVLTGYQRIFE